jgi:type IV fimbrial biogenesis protein FimT
MKAKVSCRGYSLLELLLAVALLALVQTVVAPALTDVLHSVRLHSAAQVLADSLMRARSEAIARNGRVVVCKSAAGLACEAGANWEQGWIVFHDANNNAIRDADESILHREQALASIFRLSGNTPVSRYVSYTAYGRTKLTTGAFQAGTFTVCSERGERVQARQVIINNVGRARVTKTSSALCA